MVKRVIQNIKEQGIISWISLAVALAALTMKLLK